MSQPNANPSQDPADMDTLKGALRLAFRKLVQGTDGMLPARVVAATADRNFVTVQPMIAVVATDNRVTQRAQVVKVPVLALGGGNFILSFPVKKDDFGWILANDRDISAYIQSQAASPPNTGRFKSFSDAVFIPDKARQWTLDGDDADSAVWQSLDGMTKITLAAAKITVVHPTKVEFTTPLATMSGDLTVDGTITGTTDVVGGGKSLKTHVHGGVMTGGGDTGPPV